MEPTNLKTNYHYHYAANIFPLDDAGPEFKAFVDDISRNGLNHPIVLHEGKILDGRRRHLACQQSGTEPKFVAWDGTGLPLDFVVSVNLHRRHLTPSQRAAIGLKLLLQEEKGPAKERQRLSRGRGKKGAKHCATLSGKATERAAERVGCSARLIEQIKCVHAESPALVPDIASGTLTVANALASRKSETGLALSKTQTPPSVCYWIWKTLAERGFYPSKILDPAAGSGNLTAPFRQADKHVQVIDFELDRRKDFFAQTKKVKCDFVICNPPFDKACDFLRQIIRLVDQATPMVFIGPVSSVIGFQEQQWHSILRSLDCPPLTSITPLPTATFVGARTAAVILWFNLPSVQAPVIPSEYLVRSNDKFAPSISARTALKATTKSLPQRIVVKPKVTLLHGDALEQLRKLSSESIHSCVTSPPFYLLRDYQQPRQYGHEGTVEEYIENLVAVFREVRRVLRPDGTLWVNIADSFVANCVYSDRQKHSTPALVRASRQAFKKTHLQRKSLFFAPFRLAVALENDGWIGLCDIVIEKTNPAPKAVKDRPSRTHEYVLLFSKRGTYYYDGDALREGYAPTKIAKGYNQVGDNSTKRPLNPNRRSRGSIWRIKNGLKGTGEHPAPMQLELAIDCVQAGCPAGGTVLDPFIGSGTTALAAIQHGRNCIGIDLNPTYLEITRERVSAAKVA
jgi:DNA modification methylase